MSRSLLAYSRLIHARVLHMSLPLSYRGASLITGRGSRPTLCRRLRWKSRKVRYGRYSFDTTYHDLIYAFFAMLRYFQVQPLG